jgi:hypothetical protein
MSNAFKSKKTGGGAGSAGEKMMNKLVEIEQEKKESDQGTNRGAKRFRPTNRGATRRSRSKKETRRQSRPAQFALCQPFWTWRQGWSR